MYGNLLSHAILRFFLLGIFLALSFPQFANGQDWASLGKILDEKGFNQQAAVETSRANVAFSSGPNFGPVNRAADIGRVRAGEPVLIEYDGELYPLKGWVQTPGIQELSSSEKERLEAVLIEEHRLFEAVESEKNEDAGTELKEKFSQHRLRRQQEFPGLNSSAELSGFVKDGRPIMKPTRVEDLGKDSIERESSFREGAFQQLTSDSNTDFVPSQKINVPGRERSDTTLFEKNGNYYRRPLFLLPAPRDPNDLFSKTVTRTSQEGTGQPELEFSRVESRMSAAREIGTGFLGRALDLNKAYASFRATPSFGAFYDTRTPGDSFEIDKLATNRLDGDGQSRFNGNEFRDYTLPTTLFVDTQLVNDGKPSKENQVQLHLEATNHVVNDKFDAEHAYARVWTNSTTTIGGGKTQSLFGNNGVAPASIIQSTVLIGSGDLAKNNRAQLRYQKNYVAEGRNFKWGVAIEDPLQDDFEVDAAIATKLKRWPTFSGNLTITGENPEDTFQLGALIRHVGLQVNATDIEEFDTGLGLSAYGSRMVQNCPQSQGILFAGVSGGEGVGQYIRGVKYSSVFVGGDIHMLESLGTFVGAQRRWINKQGWELSGNLAYGYSLLDTPIGLVANDTNNQLQHAWANIFVKTSDQLSYGVEWQFGRRETLAAGSGENNRFFFGIQVALAKPPVIKSSNLYDPTGNVQKRGDSALREADLYNERERKQSFAYQQGL